MVLGVASAAKECGAPLHTQREGDREEIFKPNESTETVSVRFNWFPIDFYSRNRNVILSFVRWFVRWVRVRAFCSSAFRSISPSVRIDVWIKYRHENYVYIVHTITIVILVVCALFLFQTISVASAYFSSMRDCDWLEHTEGIKVSCGQPCAYGLLLSTRKISWVGRRFVRAHIESVVMVVRWRQWRWRRRWCAVVCTRQTLCHCVNSEQWVGDRYAVCTSFPKPMCTFLIDVEGCFSFFPFLFWLVVVPRSCYRLSTRPEPHFYLDIFVCVETTNRYISIHS